MLLRSGLATGAFLDSAIGFFDGGLLTGLGADIGTEVATDMGNRLTEDNNTSPGKIRYFGDPISAMDFNAQKVLPSFKQRWGNSAHSYAGLQIADKVEIHDTPKNYLQQSPNDRYAEVITS